MLLLARSKRRELLAVSGDISPSTFIACISKQCRYKGSHIHCFRKLPLEGKVMDRVFSPQENSVVLNTHKIKLYPNFALFVFVFPVLSCF
jgi:hypothetical protein